MSERERQARAERAVRAVPRAEFLPPSQRALAEVDGPLPIGCDQTISQPSLVAEMTALLELTKDSRVLEIGTGSGFQAAVLAELAGEVFTIERIPELAARARDCLERLGYGNIRFRVGDGSRGWPEEAPFDAIIVTAAAPRIPPALLEQLKPGGRLVIPVGEPGGIQELVRAEKKPTGEVEQERLFGVRFVPLVCERPRKR